MSEDERTEASEPELLHTLESKLEDPIGDETDGEAHTSVTPEVEGQSEAAEEAALSEAETKSEEEEPSDEEETGAGSAPRPPVKLERLQKILAQAGVASRRKAEEMIEQGRVQVNGAIVTTPGTKADAGRDHIRVDGKLLHGAERQRYFVLNKPRGFVTTVKDPEGRPTVMQFFEKMRERLYPVGRLDYMSEGLLLVTNDGELAHKLTRASAGVEKTYLVKVAGVPTEGELDVLRAGVAIDKGKPGTGKVRTSPARIRQVRQGDNPWYEVVLIEGRNRELRKMFEEVGHFVEKIRRVGYGPLILDQEPGNMRELDAHELDLLRKAADGKLKTPKAKEVRRRNLADSLPTVKPAFRPRGEKPAAGPKDYKPKRAFDAGKPARDDRGAAKFGRRPDTAKPAARPSWKKAQPAEPRSDQGVAARPGIRASGPRPPAGRSFPPKPAWKKPESQQWPPYKRPSGPPERTAHRPAPQTEEPEPKKTTKLHIEPVQDFERTSRPAPDRERPDRPPSARPSYGKGRTGSDRTQGGRTSSGRPFRPQGGLARPFTTSSGKPRAGGARPSSKPAGRTFGAGAGTRSESPRGRTGSRPGAAKRPPFKSQGTGEPSRRPARPFTPRTAGGEGSRPREEESRPERRTGSGWKPKPDFGGKSRPADRSQGKGGGFSKPAFKGKPGFKGKSGSSGARGTGPRPGGKRPGGSRP